MRVSGKNTPGGGVYSGHNAEIDLYRLVFCFVVLAVHVPGVSAEERYTYPFVGGYLAVEFFFILSGYFAVRKASAAAGASYRDALSWTAHKFGCIFPYVIPTIALYVVLYSGIKGVGVYAAVKRLAYSVMEMLLLPASGLYDTFYVLPLWYLSALMLVLPLFYAALIKNREATLYLAAPLSVCLIYGYFCVTLKHIDTWHEWLGIFYSSLPRAWAGLCLGATVYLLAERLRSLRFTRAGSAALSVLKAVCGFLTLAYMATRGYRRLDFPVIGLLALWMAIAFSGRASVHWYFPAWACRVRDLTLSVYVGHWMARMLTAQWMPGVDRRELFLPYLLLSVLYAAALELLVKAVKRWKLWKKMKEFLLIGKEDHHESEVGIS